MLQPTDVAITTLLSILAIVDIVGNSLVCAIIKKNPVMRYVESEMHGTNNDILHALRWLKTVSSIFQDVDFDGS